MTSETADHNDQISDYGFDLGGPIFRDKAWVWGSWTKQDIRLVRSAGNILDRTILTTYNLKGNWQASQSDMVSVLWFNGEKKKFGRGTGDAQVLDRTATWNQGNAYPENRPHGSGAFTLTFRRWSCVGMTASNVGRSNGAPVNADNSRATP